MILEGLTITRADFTYQNQIAGQYYAKAKYKSPDGGYIELNIPKELLDPLFDVLRDALLGASKRLADNLAANLIEMPGSNLLEHDSDAH